MTNRDRRTLGLWVSAVLAVAAVPAVSLAASAPLQPTKGGPIDLAMYRDPQLAGPVENKTFDPRLKGLWLGALGRPDADLRRQAVRALAAARAGGMEGLDDAVPALLKALEDKDAAVRLAAAEALGALDARSSADALLAAVRREPGFEMALVADPILARWKAPAAVDGWQQRATNMNAPLAARISAARALGEYGAPQAGEALATLAVTPENAAALRLAAARAAGQAVESGLTARAAALERGSPTDRLVAASMLAGHSDNDAINLLGQLVSAEDATGPVVAEAARSLLAIGPERLAAQAERLVGHADPGARLALAQALTALPGDDRAPHILAALLDDPAVDVRTQARLGIAAAAAQQDVKPVVQAVLAGGGDVPLPGGAMRLKPVGWRGLEQALLLVGPLDHEAQAPRVIELLRHERPEVRLAAADALRRLELSETLPDAFARAQELTEQAKQAAAAGPDAGDASRSVATNDETTQLFMLLGALRYAEAEPLLRTYIPKGTTFGASARAAAIYALGKIKEGTLDEDLASQYAARLSDLNPMNPEMTDVRRFSAIALGRMKAAGQESVLRRFLKDENTSEDIGGATKWALEQITGQPLPPLDAVPLKQTGWFLEPAN